MKGYLAVVRHASDDAYRVEFPDLPVDVGDAPTVDEAFSNAEQALRTHAEALEAKGKRLPAPRPSRDVLCAAARQSAVAAACLRPPA